MRPEIVVGMFVQASCRFALAHHEIPRGTKGYVTETEYMNDRAFCAVHFENHDLVLRVPVDHVQPLDTTLKYGELANAFEHDLSLHEISDIDDKLFDYSDVRDIPDAQRKQYLVLVDAELEFVALVDRERAEVLQHLLNWACEHYPFRTED